MTPISGGAAPQAGNPSAWHRRAPVVVLAVLGCAISAYLIEAVLELAGGRRRWRERSWLVLALGVVAAGPTVAGLSLVVAQPLLTGTFYRLCLASAAISFTVLALVRPEVTAAWKHLRRRAEHEQHEPDPR